MGVPCRTLVTVKELSSKEQVSGPVCFLLFKTRKESSTTPEEHRQRHMSADVSGHFHFWSSPVVGSVFAFVHFFIFFVYFCFVDDVARVFLSAHGTEPLLTLPPSCRLYVVSGAAAAVRHQPRHLPRRAQDVDAGVCHAFPGLPPVRHQRHAQQQQRLHRRHDQHVSVHKSAPPLLVVVVLGRRHVSVPAACCHAHVRLVLSVRDPMHLVFSYIREFVLESRLVLDSSSSSVLHGLSCRTLFCVTPLSSFSPACVHVRRVGSTTSALILRNFYFPHLTQAVAVLLDSILSFPHHKPLQGVVCRFLCPRATDTTTIDTTTTTKLSSAALPQSVECCPPPNDRVLSCTKISSTVLSRPKRLVAPSPPQRTTEQAIRRVLGREQLKQSPRR